MGKPCDSLLLKTEMPSERSKSARNKARQEIKTKTGRPADKLHSNLDGKWPQPQLLLGNFLSGPMARGYIFAMDMVLSIIILTVFLISISFFLSRVDDPFSNIVLQKEADDALIVLDKYGDLATLNSTVLMNSLNSMLPRSVKWNMELNYYNYSGGFSLVGNNTFGSAYQQAKEVVSVDRPFLTFENKSIANYCVARLRVWAG